MIIKLLFIERQYSKIIKNFKYQYCLDIFSHLESEILYVHKYNKNKKDFERALNGRVKRYKCILPNIKFFPNIGKYNEWDYCNEKFICSKSILSFIFKFLNFYFCIDFRVFKEDLSKKIN